MTKPAGQLPEALQAYCDLELADGGALDLALMHAADREQAAGGSIHLTDELHPHASGLTPQMTQWLEGNVSFLRTKALNEVAQTFEEARIGRSGVARGQLVAAELAKIDQQLTLDRKAILSNFHDRETELVAERDRLAGEYEAMRASQDNRAPTDPHPVVYPLSMTFIVLMELALNFDSVMRLPFVEGTPAFALATATFIGLCVGSAAHVHGLLLKQWNYYFGPHDVTRAWQGGRMMAIGSLALAIGFALVAASRYYIAVPQIEYARNAGLAIPSLWWTVGFMSATNLAVYAIGVVISFFSHDIEPEYPKLKHAARKAEGAVVAARAGISGELQRVEAKHGQLRKKAIDFDTAQKATPDYHLHQRLFAELQAADERVQAVLGRYKTRLVQFLRSKEIEPAFVIDEVTRHDAALTSKLTPEAFLGRPVKLKYLRG